MAVWEGAVRGLEVPPSVLPAPSAVAVALWRGLASGLYIKHLWYTLIETLLGFLLGSALGFGLGTAVAMSRWVEYFLYPYIVMFQSLPKIALAPLIVIWFGWGSRRRSSTRDWSPSSPSSSTPWSGSGRPTRTA